MEPRILLSRLLDQAKKLGARASEALYEQATVLSMGWQQGAVGPPDQRHTFRVSVVVYLSEGRRAHCILEADSTESLAAQSKSPLRAALDRARHAPSDPLIGPADRYDIAEVGLGLLDRRQKNLGLEARRDILEGNVAGCMSVHPELRVPCVSYDEQLTTRCFASSRGVSATERSTRYDAVIEARFGSAGRLHVQRVASRQFANIASMPFGATLGHRLRSLQEPGTLPPGPLPVILDAVPVAHLLRSMAPAFSAPSVRSGRSFVSKVLGKRIASPKLHVIDDPTLSGALLSRAFDDRGVPPAPVVVVREGVASGLLFDLHHARREEQRPTGHFIGGKVQPTNLIVRPGNRSRNAIGMALSNYIVIDNLHADWPVDLETGHLSTLCDLLVFRDHEFRGAVLAQPLSMPVSQFLGSIREVGSDQARYCEVDACSLVLEEIGF